MKIRICRPLDFAWMPSRPNENQRSHPKNMTNPGGVPRTRLWHLNLQNSPAITKSVETNRAINFDSVNLKMRARNWLNIWCFNKSKIFTPFRHAMRPYHTNCLAFRTECFRGNLGSHALWPAENPFLSPLVARIIWNATDSAPCSAAAILMMLFFLLHGLGAWRPLPVRVRSVYSKIYWIRTWGWHICLAEKHEFSLVFH